MHDDELLKRLSEILSDMIGVDDVNLSEKTTRSDVPGWDSFSYINFIVAVEVEFDVKFNVSDVESFENVGDIVRELRELLES